MVALVRIIYLIQTLERYYQTLRTLVSQEKITRLLWMAGTFIS